jgi:excisionase family DNA binding protein
MSIQVWGASRLLFSRREAAQLLNISERSLDYLLFNNRIHSVKISSRRMIPRDALLNFAGSDLAERMAL